MYGLEIRNSDQLLLINENIENTYISGYYLLLSDANVVHYFDMLVNRPDPKWLINDPTLEIDYVEPELYISLPVGGEVYDCWYNGPLYNYQNHKLGVSINVRNSATFEIITAQNTNRMADINYTPSGYGIEIAGDDGEIVWDSSVPIVAIQATAQIDFQGSPSFGDIYLTSTIPYVEGKNDFFITLKGLGYLHPGGDAIKLTRVDAQTYKITYQNFSGTSGYQKGSNWASSSYVASHQFAAGMMAI